MGTPFVKSKNEIVTIEVLQIEMVNPTTCTIDYLLKMQLDNIPQVRTLTVTQKEFDVLGLGEIVEHWNDITGNSSQQFEPYEFNELSPSQLEWVIKYNLKESKRLKISDFKAWATVGMFEKYFRLITTEYKTYYTVVPIDMPMPMPTYRSMKQVFKSGVNLYVEARTKLEADFLFKNAVGEYEFPEAKISYWTK